MRSSSFSVGVCPVDALGHAHTGTLEVKIVILD
jgi:hypothetical protein